MTASAAPDKDRLRLRLRREYGLLLLLGALFVWFCAGVSYFGSPQGNIIGLLRSQAHLAVLSVGVTLVILTAGIDLSVGSIVGLSAVALGLVWRQTGSAPLALAAALAVGAACGAGNGVLVSAGRVPPLIVTLATLSVFRGLAFAAGGSESIGGFPPAVLAWSRAEFLKLPLPYLLRTDRALQAGVQLVGIPVSLWIAGLLFVGAGIYLALTDGGRAVYATGANAAAARLAGVPVNLLKLRLYVVSGLLSGLAAILYAAANNTVRADVGADYELMAITMVVFGGTSVAGGDGTMAGTALGFLTLVFIRNAMTLQGHLNLGSLAVPLTELQGVVVALLLVLALLLDAYFRRRSKGG